MANNTFIQVPNDVQDPIALHRFLAKLVEQLDVAFGERAESPFLTGEALQGVETLLAEEAGKLVAITSSLSSLTEVVDEVRDNEQGIEDNATAIALLNSNLGQPSISSLSLTPVVPGAAYVQAEAQAIASDVTSIANKLNEVIVSLEASKILS